MPRRRPVHDKLVADALARQRAAGNKISRLRRNGINPATIDPRQSASDVRNMSNAELRRYTEGLNSFIRDRRYVAGVNGAPINRRAFDYLKRLERQNNAIVAGYEQRVGGITVPTLGDQDIASQIARRNREKFTAGGEQATFQQYNRQASDITGQSSIQALIRAMQKKLSPGYLDNRMGTQRSNIEKMMEVIGDDSLFGRIAQVSNETLNVLVDYSPFMKALSARYEYLKAMQRNEEYQPEAWMQDVFDTALDEVHEFLDWAETLDTKGKKPTEYTDTNARPIPIQKTNEYTDTTAKPIPTQRPARKPGKRKQ